MRRALHALVGELEASAAPVAAARPAVVPVPEPVPLDLSFSEAGSLAVESAGLVLLWPFLVRFYARLDLLEEGGRFHDAPAAQRAVGLLGFLADGDPEPLEHRLALAKLLCGLEPEAVFDFGAPVTAAEGEASHELLDAVVAHAEALGTVSRDGFRTSFLRRAGLLRSRDGAWLLQVERQTHDLLLERLPWTFQWVRLPWMPGPLRVEW